MGFERPANNILREPGSTVQSWASEAVHEVGRSLRAIGIDDPRTNAGRSRSVIGKAMDVATGVPVSVIREGARLPIVALTRIGVDTANSVGWALKGIVKISAKAAANNLRIIVLPALPSSTGASGVGSRSSVFADLRRIIAPGSGTGTDARNPNPQPPPGTGPNPT